MGTAEIVLIVVVLLLVGLVLGGYAAAQRRQREREVALRRQIAAANEALAEARAEDRGWDRDVLEEAARALAGGPIEELHLVHVEDRPGTDDDLAVFRLVQAGRERDITLRRAGDDWRGDA